VFPADRVIIVILNPAAGTNRVENLADHLASLFKAAGAPARIVPLVSPTEAPSAIRTAIARGADVIVAAGGDGTVNSVASALAGSETTLGVIPLGTLNHFAKDIRIPLDLERAVQTVAEGHLTRVDVGDVNGRIFLNNSSIGIYPDIVVERQLLRRQGYRKWTAFAVATVKVLRHYRGVVVRITAEESTSVVRTPFLFVGNNKYHVEGRRLGARERLDSGRLFAYLAPRVHGRDLPKLLAWALIGREHDTLESFAAVALQVGTPGRRRLRVATDGEVAMMSTPLQYRVRPAALRVLVPE
jgi:diacylglycerol kinase family enzyme